MANLVEEWVGVVDGDAPRAGSHVLDIADIVGALDVALALLGGKERGREAVVERAFRRRWRKGAENLDAVDSVLAPLCDVPGDAIARAVETWGGGRGTERRVKAAFYTPPIIARWLAEVAEPAWSEVGRLPRVVDPACGAGEVLLAVADTLVDGGLSATDALAALHGWDIDAPAVAVAKGRLVEWAMARGASEAPEALWDSLRERFVVTDSLGPTDALPSGAPFDAVVGNPPFGNAISKRTARDDAQREAYGRRFPYAATGAYDRAGLFVERALQLTRPGGRVAFVLPRALLSASYARQLRTHIDATHTVTDLLRTDDATHFAEAAVYVCALALDAHTADASQGGSDVRLHRMDAEGVCATETAPLPPAESWSPLLSADAAWLANLPADWTPLGDLAHVQAGASAQEAYEFVEGLSNTEPESGWKLVTTGSIDPDVCSWGERTTRYLKVDYPTPWLARSVVSERRAALYDRPKVLVAGLSKVLEAFVDTDGSYAGAVATIAVCVEGDDVDTLRAIAAALNSEPVRRQYNALHGAQALGGGSVQVTKKKLAALRIPRL